MVTTAAVTVTAPGRAAARFVAARARRRCPHVVAARASWVPCAYPPVLPNQSMHTTKESSRDSASR